MNPALVEHVLNPILEGLCGRGTSGILRDLFTSERWAPERRYPLVLRKLAASAGRALRRRAYAELAGLPAEWRPDTLGDLAALPLVDREFLSTHRETLVDRGVPWGVQRSSTGGSTGRPLVFWVDRRRLAFDRAARARANRWAGIGPGEREAYLWGSPREIGRQDRLRGLRDRLTNHLLLPAFDLHETRVPAWFERIARLRPTSVFGYPSTLSVFSRFVLARGRSLRGVGVRAVVCAGEVLRPDERGVIGECFGARVVNQYGSRDGGFVAQECERGRLHVTAESTILEIVRDGRARPAGEEGEIVLTQLENRAMPFLRYRTGDIGSLSGEGCPCGRTLPVLAGVTGRRTDFLLTPDGRWLHGLALVYAVRDVPGVLNFRIEQIDVDDVRVSVVAANGFPPDGRESIRNAIVGRMGPEVTVTVALTDRIPADPSGKHRPVRSGPGRDREAALVSRT